MAERGEVSELGGCIKLSRQTFKERCSLGFADVDGPVEL